MNKLYFIIFGLLFYSSCNSQPEITEESNIVINESIAKQIEIEYQELKIKVENVYENENEKIELFVQIDSESEIERVPNFNDIPEAILNSYNIIRSNDNEILMIGEYPYSESGDWDISYLSYFDKNGNIVAFVRYCNFFNGLCAEIVKETSIYYFDKNHNLVKKTYEIKDSDGNPLNYTDCEFNYRYEYSIFKTLNEYTENNIFYENKQL